MEGKRIGQLLGLGSEAGPRRMCVGSSVGNSTPTKIDEKRRIGHVVIFPVNTGVSGVKNPAVSMPRARVRGCVEARC